MLAAGEGSRLRPQTFSRPKPLVSVAGRPVLSHALELFENLPQIDEIVFVVGYLGGEIRAYLSETYPHLKCRFVEQAERRGQSHALWLARDLLEGPTLVAFADKIFEADLRAAVEGMEEAVCWVTEVPDPRPYGVAEVGGEGRVRRLVEKPADRTNRLAVVGLYAFRDIGALMEAIEAQLAGNVTFRGEFFLVDAINRMLEAGLHMRAEPVGLSLDCGRPEMLLLANRYLLEHGRDSTARVHHQQDVIVLPPVSIHPTTALRRSVIGPHASIGPGCDIQDSIVRDSILEGGVHVRSAWLEGALVGERSRVSGWGRRLNLGDDAEIRTL